MGMDIRTNFSALNATKNLNKNSKALSGSLEKLASGYKINKAADDASGLAISEKMKAQIKALDTASANAQDGESMIQTTEGYLSEVHDMLNRMVELAEKSANGTYENAASTSGKNIGANSGAIYNGTSNGAINATTVSGAGTDRDALQAEMNQLCAEIDRIAATANFNKVKLFDGALSKKAEGKITSLTKGVATTGAGTTGTGLTLQIGETSTKADKLTVSVGRLHTDTLFAGLTKIKNADGVTGIKLDINANNTVNNTGTAGKTTTGYTIDISGQDRASAAAEGIRTVINKISTQRAELGAMQNRLDYTINNLNTASENVTSANSRIRNTDMAKEMTKYTQNNVLSQAAQAMLAQANQQPQQALSLLQ